jgi:hypothetical protein
MGTGSSFENSQPFRLPPDAVQHRVCFVEQPGAGQTVLLEFTDPVACRAVIVSTEAVVVLKAGVPCPDDAMDILVVPGSSRDDPSATDELMKWVMDKDPPGMAPPITITLHGAHIVWRPRRAAIVAAPERTQSLLLALVDFSFYEKELGKLERTTAESWPQLEADMSLAFEVTARDLDRLENVGRQVQRMLIVRMRHARLGPRLYRPGAHLPSLANQLDERLREFARIEDRLDGLAAQLEVFDRVYEMSSQRFSEFRTTKQQTSLEWVIIVLLAAETLLLVIEVILALERS